VTYGQYFFSLQLFNELSISFNYSTIFLQLFQLSTILFYTNIFFNYFNFQLVQLFQLSTILFYTNILFNYYVHFNYSFLAQNILQLLRLFQLFFFSPIYSYLTPYPYPYPTLQLLRLFQLLFFSPKYSLIITYISIILF
jgi:hypothetical protein